MTVGSRLHAGERKHWGLFFLVLSLIVAVHAAYIVNVVRWQDRPDFGWRTMYDSGPRIVAEVFDSGQKAGLRSGDEIEAINGRAYTTFDELFFEVRHEEPGSINTYSVRRDGEKLDVRIPTGVLGLGNVLRRSGPIFGIGLAYAVLGTLVFLMKPRAKESLIYFVMSSLMAVMISTAAPSDLIRPLWLYDFKRAAIMFVPAVIFHLAVTFPKTTPFMVKAPRAWVAPYLACALLFISYKATSPRFWNIPPVIDLLNTLFLLVSFLVFFGINILNAFRDQSLAIRIQSRFILLGMMIGIFVPVVELILRSIWGVYLFPDPSVTFTLFLTAFPLSVGYTVVKHDLFAIDVIVRRTYGYILSTATVVGAYALVISLMNVVFQSTDVSRSPFFSILFALAVVFLFRPLQERIQSFIDRGFYRQQYDYRKTIRQISEKMTSILDAGQIYKTLIESIVNEMFLENGLILMPEPSRGSYTVRYAYGTAADMLGSQFLACDHPLAQALKGRTKLFFRSEIDLNPHFQEKHEAFQQAFGQLQTEVLIPLRYKDELRGIISFGAKKSGKMFTQEDVDLLRTMTNQSAIALENAKLFEENIEKSRMEEELKIAHDIQTSMLPGSAPEIPGFVIAARSLPAREVGGDFYDFIVTGEHETDRRLVIVVGDVSGKAVSGALVMAASRSIFRVLSETPASVEEVMNRGNIRLNEDVKKGMFVALLYAVLEPRAMTLTLSNAGQTEPVLFQAEASEPLLIDTEGDRFPLGIVKDCAYQEKRVSLKIGDVVVFYTDGVVEAMNEREEVYGFERFMASIEEGRDLGADALLEKILSDVSSFVGDTEQHDDLTVVVVKAA